SKLARDHTIVVSASGLVTITGGKWTTYRKMGEDAVDAAVRVGGLEKRESRTKNLQLHGWGRMENVYGADAPMVEALALENPSLGERLHPALPLRGCEVLWAVREEMARTVADVLARRSRALFL